MKGAAPLPPGLEEFQFKNVWQAVGPELAGELAEFWRRNKALFAGEDPVERALEAIFIARDLEGTIVSVCTARKIYVNRFQQHFWFYRGFTDRECRFRGLALAMLLRSKDFFEGLFKQGTEGSCVGLMFVIENKELSARFRQAVLPRSQAVFMGYNSRGHQIRVCYFEGAEI